VVLCAIFLWVVLLSASICLGADAEIKAPALDIQTILVKETIERGETTQVDIIITNTSNITLYNVSLSMTPRDFFQDYTQGLQDIPPFGNIHTSVVVKPGPTVSFMSYKLIAEIRYSWKSGGTEFISAKTTNTSIKVNRKYQDELGSLLTGGAAALYFILPIYPAVAIFKILEQRRKDETVTLPALNIKDVIPGIIGAVLANMVVGVALNKFQADILNLVTFLEVIGVSLIVGAIVPAAHWAYDEIQWKKWGFTEGDTGAEIVRKAFAGPFASKTNEHPWVILKPNDYESWEGLLLAKRNNTYVLTSTLQVSAPALDPAKVSEDIIDGQKIIDTAKLLAEITNNNLEFKLISTINYFLKDKEQPQKNVLVKIIRDKNAKIAEIKKRDTLIQFVP